MTDRGATLLEAVTVRYAVTAVEQFERPPRPAPVRPGGGPLAVACGGDCTGDPLRDTT
ncbi:MAG: hypothetical protein ABIR97_07270 [Terracoccus sp.]